MILFDSHCHLDFPEFDRDRPELLAQCAQGHIVHFCIPATRRRDWSRLEAVVNGGQSGVSLWGALGLHPCFMADHSGPDLELLDRRLALRSAAIVAVGEVGLDLYSGGTDLNEQRSLLQAQIEIAKNHRLPLILHVRKGHDQTAQLLRASRFSHGGVVHAWSGSDQQAVAFVKLGFRLGIGGSLTWPRAARLRRQVASFALDSFVLETDSPDMPAQGECGRRNTPLTLLRVLDVMAVLRKSTPQDLWPPLLRNSCQAYHLPDRHFETAARY